MGEYGGGEEGPVAADQSFRPFYYIFASLCNLLLPTPLSHSLPPAALVSPPVRSLEPTGRRPSRSLQLALIKKERLDPNLQCSSKTGRDITFEETESGDIITTINQSSGTKSKRDVSYHGGRDVAGMLFQESGREEEGG